MTKKRRYRRMLKGLKEKGGSGDKDPWFLYILECSDGSFYTGITKDVERRLDEHNAGRASRYTRTRLPVRLGYVEERKGRTDALLREYQVKALPRAKKEALVERHRGMAGRGYCKPGPEESKQK